MINFTPEMIEKAKTAKSAEELLEIAKANGFEMTAGEAATYFAQLNPKSGELDDDDLDNVAGGACKSKTPTVQVINGKCCPKCGGTLGITQGYSKSNENGMYIEGSYRIYVYCVDDGNFITNYDSAADCIEL